MEELQSVQYVGDVHIYVYVDVHVLSFHDILCCNMTPMGVDIYRLAQPVATLESSSLYACFKLVILHAAWLKRHT